MFKIVGGTRSDSAPRLCDTCRHASIARGSGLGQERVECSRFAKPVTFRVTECSDYSDKSLPSLRMMEDAAWILTGQVKGTFGFVHSRDWRKKNPREELIPGQDDW